MLKYVYGFRCSTLLPLMYKFGLCLRSSRIDHSLSPICLEVLKAIPIFDKRYSIVCVSQFIILPLCSSLFQYSYSQMFLCCSEYKLMSNGDSKQPCLATLSVFCFFQSTPLIRKFRLTSILSSLWHGLINL